MSELSGRFIRWCVSVAATVIAVLALPSCAAEANLTESKRTVLRIGYIERSFTPAEREGIQDTFDYLKRSLPQYEFQISNYLVRELEGAIQRKEVEFFLGGSGFYRRVYGRGLRDLATMTTSLAPNPNLGVGTVFMVLKDSPYQTLDDLAGTRAASNWRHGWTGVYIPQLELLKQGKDPEKFFAEFVPAGSPMRELLLAVKSGRADVAMSRVCTLEELRQKEPELVNQFRPIGLKAPEADLSCLRSTDLYPNWTFVSTGIAPWKASSEVSAALLSMPATKNGTDWAVVSDFSSVDQLYKELRRGPYEYLRIRSVRDFVREYWHLILMSVLCVLGLILHGWRAELLVRRRTAALEAAMKKEREATVLAQRAKSRLESLERISTVGAVSSLITHELNGPLSVISNACAALERLVDLADTPANVRQTIELIERQCGRAAGIVAHVRNYVKHRETTISNIELGPEVRRVFSVQQFKHPGTLMRCELPDERLFVLWSDLELELCVTNLIKNAVEGSLSAEAPFVTVKLERTGNGEASVIVSDNGTIDARTLEDLCRPLNSSKENGLGLGLLIVRTLVEKIGGNFVICREGALTTAVIRLPLQGTNHVQ